MTSEDSANQAPLTPIAAQVTTPRFSDSPNARSKTITTAIGSDTHGTLNQHLQGNMAYQVGVHDEKGQRRTMEDAYSFVVNFASVQGQGYFAVFDGHAGKYAAEWCGQHFHEHLLDCMRQNPESPIPDILNQTFHTVDSALSAFAQRDDKMHSGCTAVTVFLRVEDTQGRQSFLPADYDYGRTSAGSSIDRTITDSPPPDVEPSSRSPSPTPSGKKKTRSSKIISAIKSFSGSNSSSDFVENQPDGHAPPTSQPLGSKAEAIPLPASAQLKRVLYTANAGDARAVLCRAGKAVRLTYDHKGSDRQEAKRIMDAGGFVMSGRVNGVLAVTRSLGDSSMKDFVVGSPYTTETELGEDDEFLILACDGVWDVLTDQQAVDLVRQVPDAQEASHQLVEVALRESTDNITVIIVRFGPSSAHD